MKTISINRAPVLTLWAAAVAEHLGFTEDESLTLGKVLAGINAQAKGRRRGVFKPHEEKPTNAREKERGEEFWIELCGRPVPAKNTEDGIRAVQGAEEIEPDSVRRYLEGQFGDSLAAVRSVMPRRGTQETEKLKARSPCSCTRKRTGSNPCSQPKEIGYGHC
jgi:hypothetical protein